MKFWLSFGLILRVFKDSWIALLLDFQRWVVFPVLIQGKKRSWIKRNNQSIWSKLCLQFLLTFQSYLLVSNIFSSIIDFLAFFELAVSSSFMSSLDLIWLLSDFLLVNITSMLFSPILVPDQILRTIGFRLVLIDATGFSYCL